MAFEVLIGAGLGAIAGNGIGGALARSGEATPVQGSGWLCRTCGVAIRRTWAAPQSWRLLQSLSCLACRERIDPALAAIELLAVAIGIAAAAAMSDAAGALAAALFGWLLLLLGALDFRYRWLPDPANLALAATGIAFAAVSAQVDLLDRLLGLVVGYASLELVRQGYRWLRGHHGLGGGDPKLFAAIGCWVGWQWLPWVMVLAALTGLAAVACLALAGRGPNAATRLPLGTMLALASWPLWIFTHPG